MVVALGCEKLTVEKLIDQEYITPENVIVLQEISGFENMVSAITEMAERKLKKLNMRRREELPLSQLFIGMQCGGSDAFSGVSANPAAGYAADLLVEAGERRSLSAGGQMRGQAGGKTAGRGNGLV